VEKLLLRMPPLPYYIAIGRTTYQPGEQHPNRRNLGIYDWLFVVQGTLSIGEDERQWEVGQGQTLLLMPDRYHYAVAPCRAETVFYWIHFEYEGEVRQELEGDELPPIRHAWANPRSVRIAQYAAPPRFSRIEQLLARLLEHAEEQGGHAYWQEQQLFLELLPLVEEEDQGVSAPAAVRTLAERTEAYLRAHYASDITNETLAAALHFHTNYIVRCMKAVHRCTPMDYLLRYRLEQAKLLLIKTDLPVAVVAERVGFRYAPYFTSCFKRHTGSAPLAFRKRHSE